MRKNFAVFGFLLVVAFLVDSVFTGCGKPVPVDSSKVPSTSTPTPTPAPAPEEEKFVEVKADVGVTHKADWEDSSEKAMSIVTVPLATYFKAQEMSVFRMQIPSAMNLYKAEIGEFPKTEEEFMKNIIEKNQIILPELPEGDSYFYNPETAELMVRAKKAPVKVK